VVSACIGAVLVIMLGAVLAWWARLCSLGLFRRQWLLGYRTALTLKDDKAWVQVHRALAPALWVAALGCIIAGASALMLNLAGMDAAAHICVGVAPVWALAWVAEGLYPAHKAAKAYAANRAIR
jgi:hypothetical protein